MNYPEIEFQRANEGRLSTLIRITFVTILLLAGLLFHTGCQENTARTPKSGENALLFVDFKTDAQPLRYEFISERDVQIDLSSPSKGKKQTQDISEKLTFITAFETVKYDPYGISKIKATIEDVKVTRSGANTFGADPALNYKGKSFTFDVTTTGEVVSYDEFFAVAKEVGETALREGRDGKAPIKNVDMVWDVIAMIQGMWDIADKVENPADGLQVDDTVLVPRLVPLPMPRPIYKLVKYKLTDIEPASNGSKIAVFEADIDIFKERVIELANPYPERFRMAGLFGFLRGYSFKGLKGNGLMRYDLDRGLLISEQQKYKIDIDASLLMPLGDTEPKVFIDQQMTVKLLENETVQK